MKNNCGKTREEIVTWRYRAFKRYLRLINDTLLFRRRYVVGSERLPKEGERFIIVCNHQNTANDPLNIIFSLPQHWHVCAMARANVFQVHPLVTRFLNWIGLTPAFRFGWEGGKGLEQNFESFDKLAERVNSAFPTIVFPEAGHTQGHYLGNFTTGTVRMAFYAAKANGWQEDIKIVPTAHHYSDFFDVQTEFLWMVGQPVSLQPYYEQFQEHPNSVMRDITQRLHESIQQMMLDEGEDDYDVKDFIRRSALNPATLQEMALPERLQRDKAFMQQLRSSTSYNEILATAKELKTAEERAGVDDITVEKRTGILTVIAWTLLLIALLPLWMVSLWPHAVCYALPPRLIRTDKMFTNSYRYVMSALLLYPLAAIITLATGIAAGWWWQTLIWLLLWIPLGRFCWWYYQKSRRLKRTCCRLMQPQRMREIERLREIIIIKK